MMRMKRGTKIGWLLVAFSIILCLWVIAGGSMSKAGVEEIEVSGTTMTVPASVTEIPNAYNRDKVVADITYLEIQGDCVINADAFANCTNLTNVVCRGTTYIKDGAFSYCANLTTISIANLAEFSASAFSDDNSLSVITVGSSSAGYYTDPTYNCLYQGTTLVWVPGGSTLLKIADGTTAVAPKAFSASNVETLYTSFTDGNALTDFSMDQGSWPKSFVTVYTPNGSATDTIFTNLEQQQKAKVFNTLDGSDGGDDNGGGSSGGGDSGGGNSGGDSGNTGGDSGNTGGNTSGGGDNGGGTSGGNGSTNNNGTTNNSGNTSTNTGTNTGANTTTNTSNTGTNGYKVIEGGYQTVAQNGGTVTIKANGDFSKFACVMVDFQILDKNCYTAKSGSTVVTFKADYIASLAAGRHNIRIGYTDGYAETELTVTPATTKTTTTVTYTVNSDGTVSKGSGKDATPTTADGFDERLLLCLGILLCGIGTIMYSKNRKLELLVSGQQD